MLTAISSTDVPLQFGDLLVDVDGALQKLTSVFGLPEDIVKSLLNAQLLKNWV